MGGFFLLVENHGYLHRFLVELAPHDRCKQIVDWSAGGQVLLDYITLVSKLEQIKLDIERNEVKLKSRTIDFLFLRSLAANYKYIYVYMYMIHYLYFSMEEV